MAIKKTKPKGKTIRIPIEAARLWKKGEPIPEPIKRYIEDQINDRTCDAVDVYEKERRTGFMGAYKGNVTELLYAVIGFLTTRKEPLILSGKHDAAPVAEIMGAIVKANGLPPTTEKWPKIKVPENTDHLTNVSHCAVEREPLTPNAAVYELMHTLRGMSAPDQETAIASFLETIKRQRELQLKHMGSLKEKMDRNYDKAQEDFWNMEKVSRGDFRLLSIQIPETKDGANG